MRLRSSFLSAGDSCFGARFLLESIEFVQMIDNGGFEAAVPSEALGAFWLTSLGRGGLVRPFS